MNYQESKKKLIDAWGTLGSSWGISRTMGQIHALLMISPKSLSTDDIMEELQISRGNVSMSLKALVEWGIVHKEYIPGDRKEYYYTEKDVWELATQVARERKRRELDPVIKVLESVQDTKDDQVEKAKLETFNSMSKDLLEFAKLTDSLFVKMIDGSPNWLTRQFIKMIK